jgi:hypothetical protein
MLQSRSWVAAAVGPRGARGEREYMSWFKRQENEIEPNQQRRVFAPRACGKSARAVANTSLRLISKPTCRSAPSVDTISGWTREAASPACSSRDSSWLTWNCVHRPAGVCRHKALSGPAGKGPARDRPQRRGDQRRGKPRPSCVVLSVMEFAFIGGSMGCVVGETIARAIDRALAAKRPAHHRCRIRRRAHDGGRSQPDAVGQSFCRPGATG